MLPLSTTTISVAIPDPDADSYDVRTMTNIATQVPAHFSSPSGADQFVGGQRVSVDMRLTCDVCPLPYTATVTDENTAEEWRVVWVRERPSFGGLSHMVAGVSRVEGAIPS